MRKKENTFPAATSNLNDTIKKESLINQLINWFINWFRNFLENAE